MQFTKIALALAATAAVAGHATAATTYLSGASATSINYVKALQSLCAGDFVVYTNATNTTSLSNFYTAKCSQDFTDLEGVDAVAFNVSGGSYTAVTASTIGNISLKFVEDLTGTPVAGSGALAGLQVVNNKALAATGRQTEGGFMDIEPAAFDPILLAPFGGAEALGGNVQPANFSQAFGVAVSNSLYSALQAAQGLPNTCDGNNLTPACQPSISRAQYATIAASALNSAKTNINGLFGVPAGKLTLCRRASTSGTQAASNQFFLNNLTGTGPAGGLEAVASAATYGPASAVAATFEVQEGAGTSNAVTCLNGAGYRVGVLSLENKPNASAGYRFVKLNRVEGYDDNGATDTTNKRSKATGVAGEYEFAFQSVKFTAAGAGSSPVIEAIDAALFTIGDTVNGLWGAGESQFGRNGNNANVITKQ